MNNIFLLFLLFYLSSCSLIEISKNPDINSYPSMDNEIIPSGSRVYIEPDKNALHASVESIFFIKDYSGNIKGTYEWKESRVYFNPDKEYICGRKYFVEFSGIYELEDGKEVLANLFLSFYYKDNNTEPLDITSSMPAAGTAINSDTNFNFIFSSPVDENSLDSGFSITPFTVCSFSWNDNFTELSVKPDKLTANLEIYKLAFTDKILSKKQIPLNRNAEFIYFTDFGHEAVSVNSVSAAFNDFDNNYPDIKENLETIKYRDVIKISFSVPMNMDKTEPAVSISPGISGKYFWPDNKTLIFIPEQGWSAETCYHLVINNWAESENMIMIQKRYDYYFTPEIHYLNLIMIDALASDSFPLTSFSDTAEIAINTGETAPHTYTFRFKFDFPFSTDKERLKTQTSINLNILFPDSAPNPVPVYYSWPDDYTLIVKYTGFTPYSITENINFYYMLSIRGRPAGIITDNGNYLAEDIKQIIRTK